MTKRTNDESNHPATAIGCNSGKPQEYDRAGNQSMPLWAITAGHWTSKVARVTDQNANQIIPSRSSNQYPAIGMQHMLMTAIIVSALSHLP